ncbi:MAG: formylglycine-generating enzyme family protein [Phycisphaerales bacterium]
MTRQTSRWMNGLVVAVALSGWVLACAEQPPDEAAAPTLEPGSDPRSAATVASMGDAAALASSGLDLDLGAGVSMRLIEIGPGRFVMGSPADEAGRGSGETPHDVTISKAFWIGQTEVTQAQWQAVMDSNPSEFAGNPNHPVEKVSWNDALRFCERLSQKTGMNFRLPTEAEWEYACRAGTTTAYSFGDDPSDLAQHAWFAGNSGREDFDADALGAVGDLTALFDRLESNGCSTRPVATKKPNAWGLHDMHGNVWEWCSDWFVELPSESVTDPAGPTSGTERVLRGGSWSLVSRYGRAASRSRAAAEIGSSSYGFRVVRTP